VRANPSHPLYAALRQIILATFGPPAIIAEEFSALDGADAVVLFGSWAARYRGQPGRAPNDIDVLVIGDADRDDVDDAAERAERRIGFPVQATVRSRAQWEAQREGFITEVRSRPLVVVLVPGEGDLEADLRQLERGGA
jgi:predicted nucleotidyltransferase